MKTRIIITLILVAIRTVFVGVFQFFYSPITATATSAQLNDDGAAAYAWAKLVRDGGVESLTLFALIFAIAIVWLWPNKPMKIKTSIIGMLLVAASLFTSGCKPVKVLDVKEIKPNETAWVIPLDAMSQSGQAKFNSVEFLNQKKVASKRVMIDKVERSIGRMSLDIEWIPAVRVITVDRTLVTREWKDDSIDGPSPGDLGIPVTTRDNIGLTIGITITVSIEEDFASTYLYYHGERPLSNVTDENIRSFIITVLSSHVSSMNLSDFQNKQAEIYIDLAKAVTAECAKKGVTVQYVGNAEGWHFREKKIQESINASYIAQQDNKTAQMEQDAQKTRNATAILNQENANKIKVMMAQAEVDAATKLQNAKDAALFQNDLKIRMIEAESKMAMATKWNGAMPASILPSDSPMLMNLGTSSKATTGRTLATAGN